MNRLDRYSNETKISKRIVKNQGLYQDLKDYTNIKEEVLIEPIIEIDLDKKEKRREIKHQEIINKNIISPLYKDEKKEYDINKVLTDARANRKDIDELEEKRNLKKDEYNIAKNISSKEIERLKKDRKGLNGNDKEELKELINTIYSNNLKDDIKKELANKDLFSELLPEGDETIIDEELVGKLIEHEKEEDEKEEQDNELKNIDNSFFTTSINLKKEDFVDNELDTSFVEKKDPKRIIIIIIVTLIVLATLGVLCYFIYKSI